MYHLRICELSSAYHVLPAQDLLAVAQDIGIDHRSRGVLLYRPDEQPWGRR